MKESKSAVDDLAEATEKTSEQITDETTTFSSVDEAVNGELERLKKELEENKSKAEAYYSQLQRLKAEFDNFRKRTQKEKEESAKYGSERVILSLLPVLDNFERAVDSSRMNSDFQSLSQGVEMIHRLLYKALEEEGLKIIDAVGQEFDPKLHDALFKEETDQQENIVLEEIQKGYYLKDRVLRPTKVKVSG